MGSVHTFLALLTYRRLTRMRMQLCEVRNFGSSSSPPPRLADPLLLQSTTRPSPFVPTPRPTTSQRTSTASSALASACVLALARFCAHGPPLTRPPSSLPPAQSFLLLSPAARSCALLRRARRRGRRLSAPAGPGDRTGPGHEGARARLGARRNPRAEQRGPGRGRRGGQGGTAARRAGREGARKGESEGDGCEEAAVSGAGRQRQVQSAMMTRLLIYLVESAAVTVPARRSRGRVGGAQASSRGQRDLLQQGLSCSPSSRCRAHMVKGSEIHELQSASRSRGPCESWGERCDGGGGRESGRFGKLTD